MRIAVMQPYVFPYLGYFQLVQAVDEFVFLDDVNFIKKGWINRNNILLNGAPKAFTIPIKDLSQNTHIRDSMIATQEAWAKKMLAMLRHAYGKAPLFPEVFPAVEALLLQAQGSIADLAMSSVRYVMDRAGSGKAYARSSELPYGAGLRGQDRIVAIAKGRGARTYVNPIGGLELYDAGAFAREGLELRFARGGTVTYPQWPGDAFVPHLSVLDALMFCPPEQLRGLLDHCSLEAKPVP